MNQIYLSPLANHLWQSTVFAGFAGLLTLALGKNRARVRYWLWLATSYKFLLPLSLLMALGANLEWRPAAEIAQSKLAIGVNEVNQPFAPLPATSLGEATPAPASPLPSVLSGIWACGFLGISAAWWVRWRRFRTAILRGRPMPLALPLPVMCAATLTEPGVFGIFRPVLMLPDGIFKRLTAAQLEAVIAHELCHVRHRDNLMAAIHMFVETVFWFHPLVWWIGKRMVDERERACDEEVLQLGSEPLVYAEGILGVCKLYVESPLTCVSGVSGANLKKRIEAIMKNRAALKLDFTRKALLAVCGVAALALPFAMGIVNAPLVRAQSSADQKRMTFDAASVKAASLPVGVENTERGGMITRKGSGVSVPRNTGGPGTDDPGRIHYPYITLRALLRRAWDSYEIDGPGWLDEQAVAVDATMPPDTTKGQFQEMLRNLITERFALQYHAQKKEITGYALVIGKNGPKLKVSADQGEAEPAPMGRPTGTGADGFPIFPPFQGKKMMLVTNRIRGRFRIIAQQVTIKELPRMLSRELGPHVTDATGLTAKYDFTLTYQTIEPGLSPGNSPEALEPAPDIFAALQSQLGLKLERKAVPVEVVVIDHMEKTPKEN